MAKIISLPIPRPQLPRRLVNDGWWLETPPARASVIAFPKPHTPNPKPTVGVSYLTLVPPRK
jgi:hypothetical protein